MRQGIAAARASEQQWQREAELKRQAADSVFSYAKTYADILAKSLPDAFSIERGARQRREQVILKWQATEPHRWLHIAHDERLGQILLRLERLRHPTMDSAQGSWRLLRTPTHQDVDVAIHTLLDQDNWQAGAFPSLPGGPIDRSLPDGDGPLR
jgi:hypothetical protein